MIRSFRRFALLLPLPLLVGCGSVLGYEDDYTLGGDGGSAGSGNNPSAGSAGGAGKAGSPNGGNGGSAAGGKAGASSGGSAGATTGGSAGISAAGNAGANSGGSAGTSTAGNAGTNSGGSGGSVFGGSAGTSSAGQAGTSSGGAGGSSSGGNAGSSVGGGGNAGTSVSNGGAAGTAGTDSGGSAGASNGGNAGASNGGNAGTASGGSAGAGTAGQGGTSVGGSGGAGGGPVNPTDCSVIYVSPTGSFGNDGCSPGAPVINPQQALGTAKAHTKEIRICEGTYPGALSLSANISIKGSYDCTTWTREPLSADAPLSKITATGSSAALFVVGDKITRETVIEGLFLQGGSGSTKSRGMSIQGGARPLVRLNRIVSGNAKGDTGGPITAALSLDVDAAARVENNVIIGGNGETSGSAVAAAGVAIDGLVGPIELVGNRITSGDALLHGKGYGTFGIYAKPLSKQTLIGVNAIRDNIVTSGTGRDESSAVEILSGAIFFDETSSQMGTIEIVGGTLTGGRAQHAGTPGANRYPTAAGIFSGNHATLTVDHVRIYAGDASVTRGSSIGLSLSGTGATTIIGSAVHGGGVLADTPFPRAVESHSTGTLTVTASTLFSGVARTVGGGTAGGTGLYLDNPGRTVLRNNFVVMHAGFTVALQLSGICDAPVASNLTGNAFASAFGGHSLFEAEGIACAKAADALPDLTARFPVAAGNIRITPEPKHTSELALGCTTGPECLGKLLTAYTSETALRTSVLTLTDGTFTPASCSLAKPPSATAFTTLDLLGRAVPQASPTVGALQVPAETCQ